MGMEAWEAHLPLTPLKMKDLSKEQQTRSDDPEIWKVLTRE